MNLLKRRTHQQTITQAQELISIYEDQDDLVVDACNDAFHKLCKRDVDYNIMIHGILVDPYEMSDDDAYQMIVAYNNYKANKKDKHLEVFQDLFKLMYGADFDSYVKEAYNNVKNCNDESPSVDYFVKCNLD